MKQKNRNTAQNNVAGISKIQKTFLIFRARARITYGSGNLSLQDTCQNWHNGY